MEPLVLNRISSEIIGCSSVEDRGVVEMVSHRSPPPSRQGLSFRKHDSFPRPL